VEFKNFQFPFIFLWKLHKIGRRIYKKFYYSRGIFQDKLFYFKHFLILLWNFLMGFESFFKLDLDQFDDDVFDT
jgi:hypothetical protein